MGDVLTVLVPALIPAAALRGFATALKPRDGGISDADRYRLDPARHTQEHYEAPSPRPGRVPSSGPATLVREATCSNLLTAKQFVDRL
jgi:hypothetical protein